MPPHTGTGTANNSTNHLPIYQSVLLSISGDSKISLQHTSVQQLSAIPEDRELIEEKHDPEYDDANYGAVVYEDEYEEPHILIQDPAPDGGYGWVIVMASFFCNLIADGIAYTFGLFFEHFVLHFATSKSKVALCGSLLNGFYLGVGPLVSSLANRFGCRFVTILGAIIACIAFALSTIAPNIETLFVTYGVLGGVGFGMIYLPAIVSVGYYFTTKRAFATGVAVCGSGIGAFLFAPFCQYLLRVTTWQNTLLILAGLVLCCSAFGSLIKPLNVHAEAVLEEDIDPQELQGQEYRKPLLQRIAEEKRRRLLAHSNSQFLLMMQQNGSIDVHDPTFNELKARLTMNTEPGVHSTLYLDQLFSQSPAPTPTPSMPCSSANQSQTQLFPEKHQLSPILEKKILSISSSENSAEELNSSSTVEQNQVEQNDQTDEPKESEIKAKNETESIVDNTLIEESNSEVTSEKKEEPCEMPSPKSEVSISESPDKADTESIYPSSITLPQSPTFDLNPVRGSSFTGSGAHIIQRGRRSSTMRTVSDCSGSGQVANSANLLHPNTPLAIQSTGVSISGQLPVQVILSTTPNHTATNNNKDVKRNTTTQTIPVRPLSKKDIFYSGSTLQIQSSVQHMAESGVSIGQSVVSIPARDIIERVQRQIQQREQDEDDGTLNEVSVLRQRKNVCNKIAKILCPFKDDLDCYKQRHIKQTNFSHEVNEEENEELNGMSALTVAGNKMIGHEKNNEELPSVNCWGRFCGRLPPSMQSILKEMLDVSLLRESSAFTILAISNVFGMMGFYVPFVYITQFAVSSVKDGDNLVTVDQAALLISVIGITNTFGRLLFGFISDRLARNGSFAGIKMTALGLNNVCVILSGLTVIAVPFCTTYLAVLLDCVLFGLFISAYICLTSIILVDMLGLDKLTNAFGLLCLFRGAASMVGPPLAGALFDITQSYYITFAASGLLLIFSSILAFFITIREHIVDQDTENDCEA